MHSPGVFLGVGIASFDMLCGIKLMQSWLFSDTVSDPRLLDVFKITLGPVHRQDKQSLTDGLTSTLELESFNWLIVSSLFFIPAKKASTYYSVSLIFDKASVPLDSHCISSLYSYAKLLSKGAKLFLQNGTPLSALNPTISLLTTDLSSLKLLPQIQPQDFELLPAKAILYEKILTSHLQTQMRTVIESSGTAESQNIANFLTNFLLPYQRNWSSTEVLAKPVSHLFLQCIRPIESGDVVDLMMEFDGPVTWISVPDAQNAPVIWRSEALPEDRRECREKFTELRFLKPDLDPIELTGKLSDIRDMYHLREVVAPAPWTMAMCGLLVRLPRESYRSICEIQFGLIVRAAISMVAIVKERPQIDGASILEKLRLVGPGDRDIALAIAALYDKDIHAAFAEAREPVGRLSGFFTGRRSTRPSVPC
jgi:hypothetical protein